MRRLLSKAASQLCSSPASTSPATPTAEGGCREVFLQNRGRKLSVNEGMNLHCISGDKFLLSHSTPAFSAATSTAINFASDAVSLAVSDFIAHGAGSDILRAAALLYYLFFGHLTLKITSIKEDPSLSAANFLTVAALTKIKLSARGALHLWLDEISSERGVKNQSATKIPPSQ